MIHSVENPSLSVYLIEDETNRSLIMIPTEVESLQTQLTNGELDVGEFFAVLLSTYEFDSSKESFNPPVILL